MQQNRLHLDDEHVRQRKNVVTCQPTSAILYHPKDIPEGDYRTSTSLFKNEAVRTGGLIGGFTPAELSNDNRNRLRSDLAYTRTSVSIVSGVLCAISTPFAVHTACTTTALNALPLASISCMSCLTYLGNMGSTSWVDYMILDERERYLVQTNNINGCLQ